MPTRSPKRRHTPAAPAPHPPSLAIPPQALALAMFASPGANDIPSEFMHAWSRLPEIVETIARGQADNLGEMNREACTREIFAQDVQQSRNSGESYNHRLSQIVDILEAFHGDAMTDLEITLGDAAFYTGLAMGLYLMTNPAPLMLAKTGGAR